MLRHYESLLKGVFNSTDVIYYLLLVALFLILSIRRLDSYRLQH
jgi:ABC-2 type transport system permease protein